MHASHEGVSNHVEFEFRVRVRVSSNFSVVVKSLSNHVCSNSSCTSSSGNSIRANSMSNSNRVTGTRDFGTVELRNSTEQNRRVRIKIVELAHFKRTFI